ncbi:MAG: DUF5009 domain-containing protein, partial [Planctomycetaceae bacterium]
MAAEKTKRLMSLDAYRGFVMLAMASSGFALSRVAPQVRGFRDGTSAEGWWRFLWDTLGYQFSHVTWTGCSAWDLIQPSFMFMVGVAMPFSLLRREQAGESKINRCVHAVVRAGVLVLLAVFLSSGSNEIRFTFANVLAQIGLGYVVVYLLCGRSLKTLGFCAAAILIAYGAWFALQPIDQTELRMTQQYLIQQQGRDTEEWSQFEGWAAHWNKHTNAAAQADRQFLNQFPRHEQPWQGRGFWVNAGGYQTFNFIPSIATMIIGLMAGTVLSSNRDDRARLRWLFRAGLVCFGLALAVDTTLWPTQWLPDAWQATLSRYAWSLCPAVKRIWTPTWAVFSSGWTLWMLAAFYWYIDMKEHRRIVFPLAVVGVNSIAMYLMSQCIKGDIGNWLITILGTFDRWSGTGTQVWLKPGAGFPYAEIVLFAARLSVMWL